MVTFGARADAEDMPPDFHASRGAANSDVSSGQPAPGQVHRWQPAPFSIDPWTVLRLSRYRHRAEVAPPIWTAARDMAARAETLVEPRALFTVAGVATADAEGVRLSEGPAFSGRGIGRLLTGCSHAVAFVLTIGPALDAQVGDLADRRAHLEAFLLDTAGWAAIEATVRALRADLRARSLLSGGRVTHRLGPGYLDWPLREQRPLLDLLGDTRELVRLSEHGVLVPLKSISGMFGLVRG